jgi:adenosylhomocysteine nucleosidase
VVVVVSARAEWEALAPRLVGAKLEAGPHGAWLLHRLAGEEAAFLHGGYGKVSAAASVQWAIDRWHPSLLVNLGTAGGFGAGVKVGDVILASRTVIYDVVERMGDPAEAIADQSTALDVSGWPDRLRRRVRVATLASADQDLDPGAVAGLEQRYGAVAGDWESGAIALVATRNRTPVVILRVVSDLVGPGGDATYGDAAAWREATRGLMGGLLDLLGEALPDLLRGAP